MTAQTHRPTLLRTTFLIDRPLQLKYFGLFAVVGGGITALWCTVLYLVRSQVEVADGAISRGALLWWYVLAVVGIGWFVGVLGLLVTHRIAGPVFVMTRHLNQLGEGWYPRMRSLRKGDDLQAMFQALTKAIERMRRDDAELVVVCDQLSEAFEAGKLSSSAEAALKNLGDLAAKRRARLEVKNE